MHADAVGQHVLQHPVAHARDQQHRRGHRQAYQISFNELFHALGWIFLILMSVIWLTRPPFSGKARVAVADH
ncbi:hypothetical protein ELR50_03535 [Pseudomonas citronellolis]|nr:hypothetical protein ELR50_03535 [Pseudomonas citronellolis]